MTTLRAPTLAFMPWQLVHTALRSAAQVAVACSLALPALAHEGHDHASETKPVDVRLAPRFEVRSEEVEIVGVLAGKNLLIYLDRAADNSPIHEAQIEVEGPGVKGVAEAMADGIYQLPAAALGQPGKYPLTLTVQAGEIADLLSANLEVAGPAAAATAAEKVDGRGWLFAAIPLVLIAGGLLLRRRHRQPQRTI